MLANELAQFDPGILIVGAALSVALVVATLFGLWGIAAIVAVFGCIICAINSGFPQPVGPFFLGLGLLAFLLVIMRLGIRRTFYPLSMRKLVRGLPLVAIASTVITLIFLQAVEIFQGGGFRIESFVFDSIVVGLVQLIIGYAVVVPAYRWFGRPSNAQPAEGAVAASGAGRELPSAPAAKVVRPRAAPSTGRTGFTEANYGVPHTKFQRTDDGFTVRFRTTGEALYKLTVAASGGGGALLGLLLIVVFIVWGIIEMFLSTTITVDKDSITINGRRMRREDFGSFAVHHTITGGNKTGEVLGYTYGSQSFAFGGVWEEGKATEVAAALNRVLRTVPMAADECRVSSEELRSVRPSEF